MQRYYSLWIRIVKEKKEKTLKVPQTFSIWIQKPGFSKKPGFLFSYGT